MNALPQPQDCCTPCETPTTVSVPGPQGVQGEQGEQGDQGIQGIQGDQGIQGIQGVPGPAGTNPTTTKGDLITDSGGATPVRLAVGTNFQTLHSDSAVAYGVRWKTFDLSGAASSITGSLPLANGGTAGTSAATARTNLGLGTVAVLNTVTVAQGGTGATTAAAARTNLGISNASDAALYQHQQASGVAGGTFTLGAWRTIPLTIEVFDPNNIGTLAANQVTLIAGTYRFTAWTNAYQVSNAQGRLFNVTTASVIAYGRSSVFTGASTDLLTVEGRFTIAGATVVQLEAQSSATQVTDGFGSPVTFGGTEVYAGITFIKE